MGRTRRRRPPRSPGSSKAGSGWKRPIDAAPGGGAHRNFMEIRRGIGVSPGYAIGEAFVLSDEEFAIPRKEVAPKEIEGEVARLENASKQAIAKIADQLSRMSKRVGQSVARILQAHMGLLGDEKLRAEIAEDIRRNQHSAEY